MANDRLLLAVGGACASSALLIAGAATGVVADGRQAYESLALLIVLAAAPAVLSVVLVLRGKPAVAAGVLSGAGMVAVGRLPLDAQFAVDPTLTTRPELYLPVLQFELPNWWGVGFLLAGHLVMIVSGVVAVRAALYLPDDVGSPAGSRQRVVVIAMIAGLLISLGVLIHPFFSDNALLIDNGALDGPPLVLAGALLLAIGIPMAIALAASATAWGLTKGVLLGLAVAASAAAIPSIAGVIFVPWLHLAAGPIVAVLGAAGLAVLGSLRAGGLGGQPPSDATDDVVTEARMPRRRMLDGGVGALALATAVAAVAGASTPMLAGDDGAAVENLSQSLLGPAGVLVGVLGVAMFVPKAAAVVRPALSVAWVGVLLVGVQALALPVAVDTVLPASRPGIGVVWTAVAVLGALLLAACSLVAGVVEREDTERVPLHNAVMFSSAIAGPLVIGAFGLPVISAAEYQGSGLAQRFDLTFWGVLVAMLVVLGALALAPLCRSARAAALLLGAVGVVVVRLLELPLVGRQVDGFEIEAGTWFGFAAVAVLAVAAGIAVVSGRGLRAR
ncbi:MAG: hypothetical protein GEU86_17980 [Actinophytocola sp.]|nr:hypothetical protein [Actinophytocola sp.]